MTTIVQEISICGAVDLLAAIFGIDPDELRLTYGLPTKRAKAFCMCCGKPTPYKRFCNHKCQHEYAMIPLECPECGIICYRQKSWVVWHLNHPQPGNGKEQQKFFCSKHCLGKWIGEHYGFGAHRN